MAEITIAPELRYFTGRPCKRGHLSERLISSRGCMECAKITAAERRAYDKERRPEYAERKRELRKMWRQKESAATLRRRADPSLWGVQILPGIRHRAKKAGLECTIGPEHLMVPEVCPVLGLRLVLGTPGYATGIRNSPSVDRFDNTKGYTPDNVRVISLRANLLKKDATAEEIRLVLRYMEGGS